MTTREVLQKRALRHKQLVWFNNQVKIINTREPGPLRVRARMNLERYLREVGYLLGIEITTENYKSESLELSLIQLESLELLRKELIIKKIL